MDDYMQICPLDSSTYKFRQLAPPMGSNHLLVIENHVSSNNCVNCPHPPLKEFIFGGRLMGTTPLLLACHCGEFDSVKHIVEHWGVDVRTAATYYLQLSRTGMGLLAKIESATPLFVAAFQGHSKIVRYLLEKGADVTAKTSDEANPEYDGLTPLHGAVSELWMPPHSRALLDQQCVERNTIVLSLLECGADLSDTFKPLWPNSWCDVGTTMALINHGLDLKQRDPYSGRTLLHYWASPPHDFTAEDSLTMVKLLIGKGAAVMARDNFGFTPILTAANGVGPRLYLDLLDFLLERDDIDIMEKIEAMELAGANIFSCAMNGPQFPKACHYWRRATHLRQVEGSGSYQKKLAETSVDTVEWTTSDQLEHFIQHPSEYKIKIQSLLVQLRILSSRSWKAVNHFLAVNMSKFACMEYLELLDVYRYFAILETILLFQSSEKGIWNRSVSVVKNIIYTLFNLKSSNPTLYNLDIVKKSIHVILAADRFHSGDLERETHIEYWYTRAMFIFLKMLLGLPEMLDGLWGILPQLFRHLRSEQVGSLLLPACKDYKNKRFFATIRLLLQLGANVDAADKDGNGPLHLVAQSDSDQSEATGCLLLGYGAQLFRTNNYGKTAADLWIELNEMEDDQEGEEGAAEPRDLPDWCRTVPKLLCLSARSIRAYDVPYKDQPEFFQESHSFIEKH